MGFHGHGSSMRSKNYLWIAQCPRALVLAALVISAVTTLAQAQGYPTRVVRVVVAYPAGGSIDVVARLVSQRLSSALRQPFVIDNRAGAAGNIGTDYVAKAPGDGYILLMELGLDTVGGTPEQFASFVRQDIAKYAKIVRVAAIPPQ